MFLAGKQDEDRWCSLEPTIFILPGMMYKDGASSNDLSKVGVDLPRPTSETRISLTGENHF